MSKIALVTGGSRGIGAAVCRQLAERGYQVAVNYRTDEAAANSVVEELTSKGATAIAVQGDVGSEADVMAMFKTVDEKLGRLDALVNNAGITGPKGRFDALSADQIQRVIATNVIGPAICSREAIKRMSTNYGGDGGAIVNVTSGSAYIGNPGSDVLYALSKGGLDSMQIGLSQEVGSEGIRINSVAPGMTDTDMVSEAGTAANLPNIPFGRLGKPEEIANAIVWLLSDEASYVAGAKIRVAGGRP